MVEGLSEEPDENLRNKLTQLCNCIGLDLGPDDIVSAYRIVRCNPIKGRPNPARVTFRDLPSKEKFMIIAKYLGFASFTDGKMECSLLAGSSSHSACHVWSIYSLMRGLRSVCGTGHG